MLPDLKLEIERLKTAGRLNEFVPVHARQGAYLNFKGRKLVDFSNWDLFHVNCNKRVITAVHEELETCGLGGNSPRLSSGTSLQHLAFEKRMAQFLGLNKSVLFASRNQAVLSLVTSILDERSVAIVDELLQSPVADAAYLVNACIASFDAAKVESLEAELQKAPESFQKYVFVESFSPMRGKLGDLAAFISLANKYGAFVIVDESFSLGVLGLRGAGSLELLPSELSPYCVYGSLSYGLSSIGAFVAGDMALIDFLINQSRTFVSESPLPAAYVAGMEAALNIVELNVVSREWIKALGLRLKRGLNELSFEFDDFAFPVLCIAFKKRKAAAELAEGLFEKGFFVDIAAKGAFLDAGAILRILINTKHTEAHIDALLEALSDLLKVLGLK